MVEAPVSAEAAPNPLAETHTSDAAPEDAQITQVTGSDSAGGPSFITLGGSLDTLENRVDSIDAFGTFAELVEQTSNGPLPRTGPSGLKPYEAYARPSVSPQSAGGKKLLGVVVTGLGLNESSTREAIRALPGAVTLAFAPYGTELESLTAEARTAGHELMLEIPLEPFDYPQNDPGPHTLLVEQPPRENLEKLYWLLSRMGGYTGVLNHMGARFTASAADFGPIMEEFGLRGLAYLDDGSSNRSVAPQLASQNKVPFVRADQALDTNPARSEILSALAALQESADERGWAVGTMSALPVSIRTLAEWAEALDQDQYLLVPISALSNAGRESS